jgi:hypothetical protein
VRDTDKEAGSTDVFAAYLTLEGDDQVVGLDVTVREIL